MNDPKQERSTVETAGQVVDRMMAEGVKVIRTEPLQGPLAKIDVTDQTEHGLALFEERVKVAKQQLGIALKLTQPGQWVVMDGGKGKETVYATAGAADRILRMGFGMRWGEKTVTLTKNEDDEQVAIARAPLLKHDGEVYEVFEGRRTIGGYVKNENDLVKASLANLAHVAVTQLLGLRFLTPADFKELGLDLSTLPRRAEFQDHGEDPGAAPVVPFGKNKGTPITKLDDRDLAWHADIARKNIADPEKAKFRAKEQKWLAALEAERERRSKPAPAPVPPPRATQREIERPAPEPPPEREPGDEPPEDILKAAKDELYRVCSSYAGEAFVVQEMESFLTCPLDDADPEMLTVAIQRAREKLAAEARKAKKSK